MCREYVHVDMLHVLHVSPQELASFIDSRREAFYNHFMMASSPSSPSASPRGGPQHSQHRQGQPLGMVSKAAAAAVLQRAVPGASHADIR